MKHIIAATAAALAFGIGMAASAADLGAPAPAPIYTKAPLAVPSSWTGLYVGGNVGWGWANPSSTDDGVTSSTLVGSLFDPNTFSLSSNGVVAGGHLGYNYQFAPTWVAGVENDFDYAHLN